MQAIVAAASNSTKTGAFGSLSSGRALEQKFAGLIAGESYSLDSVLRQHIEVIEKLKAAFETAAKRYVETDQANAANLTAHQADRRQG